MGGGKGADPGAAVSVPLIPDGVGGVTLRMADRLLISQMLGKSPAGVYSVGFAFGSVALLAFDALNKVWSPWMYRQLADMTDERRRKIVRFTDLYKVGVPALAVLVTAGSYLVLPVMVDGSFHGATKVVFWIALGFAVRGMYTSSSLTCCTRARPATSRL